MSRKRIDGTTPAKKGAGIRWTLFAYLAVFCVAVLLLIWLVQGFLLNRIYYGIQLGRMDTAAAAFSTVSAADDPQSTAEAVAAGYDVSVAVFYADGDSLGEPIARANGGAGSMLDKLKNTEYLSLYQKALEEGGKTTEELESRLGLPHGAPEHGTGAGRLLYVRVLSNVDGDRIAVFLDATLVPQGASASTLLVEIVLLSIILVIAALCLARAMSRRIARPIARITEGAKQLATGHYDITFEEGGYREINELSATLNYAADELSKVDRLQKELIANVSHDLRTPLTTIIGYGEVMRDIEGENKPENVQVIIDEAKRLSLLVNDLLELSRVRLGAQASEHTVFELGEAVSESVSRYAHMLASQGYEFSCDAEGDILVSGDLGRLLQVVHNLISNAVNYAGEDKRIAVSCRRLPDGWARVEVIDRGEGIPADKLPHIWERYYKVDATHKRSVIGSGLGLSIVRGILEEHGARYGVQSRLGEGSRFWFELPIHVVADLIEE